MALAKHCDNQECNKSLGGDINKPFVQVRMNRSDQREGANGEVMFRYLTDHRDQMFTFCNDECEQKWKEHQRTQKTWTRPGRFEEY